MNKEVLAIKDNPMTCAAALVAATLLYDPTDFLKFLYLKDDKFCFIEPLKKETQEEVFDLEDEQNERIIFISEDDLKKYLLKMRDQKFNGAVLVFSTKNFSKLKEDYVILKAAKGSHEAFKFPYEVSNLLIKVKDLRSILKGNMRHLKHQIKECKTEWSILLKNAEQALEEYQSNNQSSSKHRLDEILKEIEEKCPQTAHGLSLTRIEGLSTKLKDIQNELSKFAESLNI
jgi:hypothetical protein